MAKERKQYTEEQKAAIKARRDERNAAVKALINVVLKSDESTDEMKELALIAKPKQSSSTGTGSARVSLSKQVAALFDDNEQLTEDQVFDELKVGRPEMAKACKAIIKNAKPEDRKWIAFDPETGVYTLEGQGAETPAGWTGYVPVEDIVTDDESEEDEE